MEADRHTRCSGAARGSWPPIGRRPFIPGGIADPRSIRARGPGSNAHEQGSNPPAGCLFCLILASDSCALVVLLFQQGRIVTVFLASFAPRCSSGRQQRAALSFSTIPPYSSLSQHRYQFILISVFAFFIDVCKGLAVRRTQFFATRTTYFFPINQTNSHRVGVLC